MTPDPINLTARVDALRADLRFRALFAAQPMTLAMWLLETEGGGAHISSLLYAWVVASPPAASGWTWSGGKDFGLGVEGVRHRFRRIVLVADPDTIERIVTGLLDGMTLAESCGLAGTSPPEYGTSLRLGKDRAEVERSFVFGPIRFLVGRSASA